MLKMSALAIFMLFALVWTPSSLRAEEAAFVGMQVQGISKSVARALGYNNGQGVLVRDVYLGGPANKGGIQRGDLILKFGDSVFENRYLPEQLYSFVIIAQDRNFLVQSLQSRRDILDTFYHHLDGI